METISQTSSSINEHPKNTNSATTYRSVGGEAAHLIDESCSRSTAVTKMDPVQNLLNDGDALLQSNRPEAHHGFMATLKLYPTSVAWSAVFSMGVVMLAFDPQLLGDLYAMPAFQKEFGYQFKGQYIIPAPWQTGLSIGNPVGQALGALAAGLPMERFGRKRTFIACVVGTGCCVFVQFFATSLPVLLVGELLGGLILGAYVVIAPTYASEVAPIELRGVLTSYTNLCFVAGQLIANGVTAGTSKLENHWAYSIPFALQWFWVILILPVAFFAPESPWWLVRQRKVDEACHSLLRLASSKVDINDNLCKIIKTDQLEREIEAGSTYWNCFNAANRRRSEICVGVYAAQVLSGIYLVNYGTYFFQLAGLPVDRAFDMGIGFLGVGFAATCFSWVLLHRVGRRTLFNLGLVILAILQYVIAVLDCASSSNTRHDITWVQSCLLIVWNFFYNLSIGPVTFVILCEVSATRVRSKTIAIATAAQAILGIIMTVAIPYLINPDQADLRGKLGFFFGGLATLSLIWSWVRVPETADKTYEELDVLFTRGVSARQFKKYPLRD